MKRARHRWLSAVFLLISPAAFASGDYVGTLRPSANAIAIPQPGFYWPMSNPVGGPLDSLAGAEGSRLKLGYRYSRYLAVETGYASTRGAGTAFGPAPLRATGFSMETVGTLPLWMNGALFGRIGAYRYAGAPLWIAASDRGHRPDSGLRYGLGFKYDLTRHLRVQAEMERFSPLDRLGTRDADADQVSVGVTWRF